MNNLEEAPATNGVGVPIKQLPHWAREQLGTAAVMLLPPDMDPDAQMLVEHIRFLERELTELNERAAHGFPDEDDSDSAYTPFPVDVLPDALSNFVRAASEATPCPPAMVAVPVVSALAGAVGAAAHLQLKRTWTEIPILWTAIVAPSGSTKSPAADHALKPVRRRERAAYERYEQEMELWESMSDDEQERRDKPTRKRYRTGDITREKVSRVLDENPRGVLLERDELATWLESFDRYSQGAADLHAWLSFYEARQETIDRVGSDDIVLDSPAVSVFGTIQPGTLRKKLTELHFETGFAPRMMLVMPPTRPKKWTSADVTREVQDGYDDVLTSLYELPPGTRVELSREARDVWANWYDAANAVVYETPEGPARAVAAKTVGHAARLALLLHLAETRPQMGAVGALPPRTLQRGIRLAMWFRSETLRVYDELNLVADALQPIDRYSRKLPKRFDTDDAKAVAQEMGVPERTMYDWLKKLRERGQVERLTQGKYRRLNV